MFERLSPGDFRLLRGRKRTDLLLVELNSVSCSSQSTMEAGGTWTGQGYSAPWMYHGMAGQYTLLEKQLTSDLSPYRRRPVSRVLQDSTNWYDAQLPPRWGLLKQDSQWFSGKDLSRATSSPKAQRQLPLLRPSQCSPTYDGRHPVCRKDGSWGAASHPGRDGPTGSLAGGSFAAAPSCRWYPGGASSKSRDDPPARAPPTYEAHMLLRLRAGQGPRKENWPHPPPYVAPPSYEAPHRTVQPQPQLQPQLLPCQLPHKEALTGKQIQTVVPKKHGERVAGTCETGMPLRHGSGRKAGRHQAKIPGSWSYLSGANTWGGPRRQPERAEFAYGLVPSWDVSPQCCSHTLPRMSKRNKEVPMPCPPQHTLPAGWGFSHAVGWPPGAVGNGSRAGDKPGKDLLPRWKEPSHAREPGGSQGSLSKLMPRRRGGLFVIDATCVVIQAHYIPAPRTEHVRYLGQEGLDKVRAALPPGSPAPVSMEERAARILGLSVSELGFTEAGKGKILGPGILGPKASESSSAEVAVPEDVYGAGQSREAPSAPASPRKPLPTPTPHSFQAEPTQQGLHFPNETEASTVPCQESGCAQPQGEEEPEPVFPPPSRSYALDLKEAMSRIRRHTAPDSDTDEELEKECQPVSGRPAEWRGRLNEGALSYSSSSLDSSSSNATVVPGNATPTLRNQSGEPPLSKRGPAGLGTAVTMKTD